MNSDQMFVETSNRYAECYDNLVSARLAFMSFNDVMGVGIGPKQSDCKLDISVVCFLVYVKIKRPAAELEANEFIPKEFSGIMTDVVEVGSRLHDIHNEFDARWLKQSLVEAAGGRCNTAVDEVERLVV